MALVIFEFPVFLKDSWLDNVRLTKKRKKKKKSIECYGPSLALKVYKERQQ